MRIIEFTLQNAQGEQRFSFQPNLNIILEPDATLRRALWEGLITVLYGPPAALPQPDQSPAQLLRAKRKGASSRKAKSPDKTAKDHLEGTLLLALDDGRKFQLRRSVSAATNTLHVVDLQTGKELSADDHFTRDFAERHLSLSRTVFAAAAVVTPESLRTFADAEEETLAEVLSRVLDSANAGTSIHTAILRIDRKLAEIGTLYSAGSLMATAYAHRDALQQKRAAYLAAHRAASDDHTEAEELTAELEVLQTRLSILEHETITNQLAACRARLTRYDDCQRQIERIIAEQEALAAFKEFPVSAKEKFFQLHHELMHLEKLQELLHNERNTHNVKLMGLAERSRTSNVDEDLWERHHFEEFYALRTHWQATFEQILGLEAAKHEADAALEAAGLDAADRAALAALDSTRLEFLKAREAAIKAKEQEAEKLRVAYDLFQSRTQSHRRAGALGALVVLGAITLGLFYLEGRISQARVWGGILPLVMSVGGLLLFLFLNYRWLLKSRQLASDLLFAEKSYMEDHQNLRELLSGFKVENLSDLIRQRMMFIEIGSASQEHAKRAEELARIERVLLPWMEPLGLNHIAPETLMAAEERFRESHQIWQERKNANEQIERIAGQLHEMQENRARLASEIEKLLAEAKIALPPGESSFQAYVQACQKREYLETLHSQRRQIMALADEILRGQTRQQLVEEINRLENSMQRFTAPRLKGELAETTPPAEIRERIESLENEIAEKRQRLAVNQERMRLRDQSSISLAEIDEDLALAEDEISRLHAAEQALQIARNNLLTAKQRVHQDFARRATAAINRHVRSLTSDKHTSARLDPSDFSLQLSGKDEHAGLDQVVRLDAVAQRNIFLFLRLSMPALMTETRESVPMIIETPWREHELKEQMNVRRVLESLAKQQQILCITDNARTAEILRQKVGMEREKKLVQ